MSDYKTTITCPNCSKNLRFPIKENRIKFSCSNCDSYFEAINGKIIKKKEQELENESNNLRQKVVILFKKIKTWKIMTFSLIGISLVLVILLYHNGKEKGMKDKLTTDFLMAIKTHNTIGFDKAKSYLTKDTKELFGAFIESQYKYNDSASVTMIELFIESLTELEYKEKKEFSYINEEGGTNYFFVDFILVDDEYKIDVNFNEFIK